MKICTNFRKISLKFRFKNINETGNYFLEEIEHHELNNKKHKKRCIAINFIEVVPILVSAITGCILISAFASLLGICIIIMSFAIGLDIFGIQKYITAGIQKYKSIIKEKKKKQLLWAKSNLSSIEALISKALMDSVISHDEFVLMNNTLKEYDEMKKRIKKLNK